MVKKESHHVFWDIDPTQGHVTVEASRLSIRAVGAWAPLSFLPLGTNHLLALALMLSSSALENPPHALSFPIAYCRLHIPSPSSPFSPFPSSIHSALHSVRSQTALSLCFALSQTLHGESRLTHGDAHVTREMKSFAEVKALDRL